MAHGPSIDEESGVLVQPMRIVRDGYNEIAEAYLASRRGHSPDVELLGRLTEILPEQAAVLDAGCGAGMPVTQELAQRCRVTGVDFSMAQLRIARELVPKAAFICQDLTHLGLTSDSFDGICSYYAIIHIPRAHHTRVFADFLRLLVPGGVALLCLGAEDLEEEIAGDYFGSTMYWSHFDEATNKRLLRSAGFEELWSARVQDPISPTGSHTFVLVRKPFS